MHRKIKTTVKMTTATHTALQNLAKQAAEYITKLNGEAETFEVVCGDYLAVIAYEAEIAEDKGDYWTAPYSWIEYERTTVKAVYDENGDEDKEATKWLQEALN